MRPILVLGETEITTPRFTVTRDIPVDSVRLLNVHRCEVNGRKIAAERLTSMIADSKDAFLRVTLFGLDGAVRSDYEISFEVPAVEDLELVERRFSEVASDEELSIHAINSFITASSSAKSSRRYLESLSNYLFGVLAKNRKGQSSLSLEQGRAKLNEAGQYLQTLDRPLARVISAIVDFQSNSFERTHLLRGVPLLRQSMEWFKGASQGTLALPTVQVLDRNDFVGRVPLDDASAQIIDWTSSSARALGGEVSKIIDYSVCPDWLPEDKTKAKVIAALVCLNEGKRELAIYGARSFRHDFIFGGLAEKLISAPHGIR